MFSQFNSLQVMKTECMLCDLPSPFSIHTGTESTDWKDISRPTEKMKYSGVQQVISWMQEWTDEKM